MTAFGGDKFINLEIERLVKEFGIKTIVETGTYRGETTIELAKLAKTYTIELNKDRFHTVQTFLKDNPNIEMLMGNSPEVLKTLVPLIEKPVLFYLDAHWGRYFPLLDELKAILGSKVEDSIIVVHDCYVPDRSFGYDAHYINSNWFVYVWNVINERLFKGSRKQRLDWEFIKDVVYDINPNYKHYYNKEAEGDMRGVIYIVPSGEKQNE